MKKVFSVLVLSLVLAGCAHVTTQGDVNETLSGTLTPGAGDSYMLQLNEGGVVELRDGAVSLQGHEGRSVKVTGQYSGSTLYVDQIVDR